MKSKKLKKLVLNKETIANLSFSEQSRLKGGSDGAVCETINRYLTGTISHYEPADCINGYGGTDLSYCYCTNGQQTCDTCNQPGCNDESGAAFTCTNDIFEGGCAYTQDYEVCPY